ncbi:PadR family transcriptional regulator [Bacillus sp. SD088]|nr:PadR family transcriptional regulator [Bacillus sp. SD088]
MKKQMDGRINLFYKINNNQLYPTLSKLESDGLIKLESYEKESYRPARKIYKITDAGIEDLKSWIVEPSEPGDWDEFLLKQYSAWLIKPETMMPLIEGIKREHKERLEGYMDKVAELREQYHPLTNDYPIFSSIAVVELGIRFERSFLEWCDYIVGCLNENRM